MSVQYRHRCSACHRGFSPSSQRSSLAIVMFCWSSALPPELNRSNRGNRQNSYLCLKIVQNLCSLCCPVKSLKKPRPSPFHTPPSSPGVHVRMRPPIHRKQPAPWRIRPIRLAVMNRLAMMNQRIAWLQQAGHLLKNLNRLRQPNRISFHTRSLMRQQASLCEPRS